MSMSPCARVAIIGADIAGTSCARLLTDAGHSARLFDKSGGVGGRMATRRAEWLDDDGIVHPSSFDHGAPGFTARSPDFGHFVKQAVRDGLLARWVPVMAPGSYVPLDSATLWVPVPDMPSLCRGMLSEVSISPACAVDALRRGHDGWSVESAGAVVAQGFSDVVLAVPLQQAAPVLQPDWAERAAALPMAPAWTLMGVSQTHLQTPVAEVQAMFQDALVRLLGRPLTWHHTAVHRWRYASVPRADASASAAVTAHCWWDASLGLGVCGDALGGAGVEGAWTSGRALATSVINRYRAAPAASGLPAARSLLKCPALCLERSSSLG